MASPGALKALHIERGTELKFCHEYDLIWLKAANTKIRHKARIFGGGVGVTSRLIVRDPVLCLVDGGAREIRRPA
jgi:hypothetical protein